MEFRELAALAQSLPPCAGAEPGSPGTSVPSSPLPKQREEGLSEWPVSVPQPHGGRPAPLLPQGRAPESPKRGRHSPPPCGVTPSVCVRWGAGGKGRRRGHAAKHFKQRWSRVQLNTSRHRVAPPCRLGSRSGRPRRRILTGSARSARKLSPRRRGNKWRRRRPGRSLRDRGPRWTIRLGVGVKGVGWGRGRGGRLFIFNCENSVSCAVGFSCYNQSPILTWRY